MVWGILMSKRTSGFNVERAAGSAARISVFDRIVREIEPVEIPSKYIHHIQVQYSDGTERLLNGDSLSQNIPVGKDSARRLADGEQEVQDVKVHLNIDSIERDVNAMVESLLGPHC